MLKLACSINYTSQFTAIVKDLFLEIFKMTRNADLRKLWITNSLFCLPYLLALPVGANHHHLANLLQRHNQARDTFWASLLGIFSEVLSIPTPTGPICIPPSHQPLQLFSVQHKEGIWWFTQPHDAPCQPSVCLFEWSYCCSAVATFVTIHFFFYDNQKFSFINRCCCGPLLLSWISVSRFSRLRSLYCTESDTALHRFLWIAGFLPATLDSLPTKQGVAHYFFFFFFSRSLKTDWFIVTPLKEWKTPPSSPPEET